jgi:uncharacterized membrane protein/thiol-disulfide isomerase/thioredoxin
MGSKMFQKLRFRTPIAFVVKNGRIYPMKKYLLLGVALLAALTITMSLRPAPDAAAQAADNGAVVKAVLFFSPSCPHCHEVINKLIIPMVNEYGDQLQVLGVDVTTEAGQAMYQTAIEHYQITPERMGVPTLVVEDTVLVGRGEIPEEFPAIVKEGLASGGIDWPAIPGLTESLAAQAEPTTAAATTPPATAQAEPTTAAATEPSAPTATAAALVSSPPATPEKQPEAAVMAINEASAPPVETAETSALPPDPVAASLAGLVLGAMVFALFFAARSLVSNRANLFNLAENAAPLVKGWLNSGAWEWWGWGGGLPGLRGITHVTAVCGPIGDCNAVQASPYAQIAGVPVALLGILNYLVMMLLWAAIRYTKGQPANLALLGLIGLGMAGVFFSIYLTILELFVIRAVCAWCVSSAVIVTAIMLCGGCRHPTGAVHLSPAGGGNLTGGNQPDLADWQADNKLAALPRRADYGKLALVGLHQLFGNGQPQANAPRFGGKQRLKYFGQIFRGDAGATITDRKGQSWPLLCRSEGQCPPGRHSLAGIGDEVGQYLANLLRVNQYQRQIGGHPIDNDNPGGWGGNGGQLVFQQIRQQDRLTDGRPLPGKTKQIGDNFLCLAHFGADDVKVFLHRLIGPGQDNLQKVAGVVEYPQRIAQLVADPAG